MSDDRKIAERIAWRIGRHNLDDGSFLYADLDQSEKESIEQQVELKGTPVVGFFRDPKTWTVLTTRELVSCHNGGLHRQQLASLPGSIEPAWDAEETEHRKDNVQYLIIGNSKTSFWCPRGPSLYALWNTIIPWSQDAL